jgi:tetratricopeptide (TPR) repeat protein
LAGLGSESARRRRYLSPLAHRLPTLFVAWPQRNPSLWALDAYNSGWQALESDNRPFAEKKLAIAYAYVPTNSETIFALGNLRLAEGNIDQAQSFYRAALKIDPQHKGALNNLGVTSLQTGRLPEAQHFFEEALKQAPHDAKTHYLLAKTLFSEGDREAAQTELEIAIGLKPDQPEFKALGELINVGRR